MSSYNTIQQHQPLRVPQSWGTSERRFVAQLEEVLDDIYRRFGRLRWEDLGKVLQHRFTSADGKISLLEQSAEQFEVKLSELGTPEELANAILRINHEGIFLYGGVIDLQAQTTLKVQSGGAVQIDAKDGANSFIRLGDGNFNATQSGDVSAKTGDFAEGLAVGSKPVWHSGNAVVSTSQPEGHGILWIRPSETQTVRYAWPTGPERTVSWRDVTHSFELAADTGDYMAGSSFTYTLSIPVYEISDAVRNVDFMVSLRKSDATVVFPTYTIGKIAQWELQTIRLTVESNVNLAIDADPITLEVLTEGANSGLYLQRNMEIALQIRSDSASDTAQSCSVHWIP